MVMDLLGPSLEDLMYDQSDKRFSLKTTIMLASQMISRVEYVHNHDYVFCFSVVFIYLLLILKMHRDIKVCLYSIFCFIFFER